MTSGFIGIAFNFIKSSFGKKAQNKGNGKVWFSEDGRSGKVGYQDEQGSFGMYWEFGGGDVIAIISVPTEAEWEAHTKLPLSRRMAILNLIGSEAIRQKNGGRGRWEITADSILIK